MTLIFAYIYCFYLLFVVTMAAKAAWPILTVVPRVLLLPAALLAVAMDVTFNVIIATVIFFDPPQEWMFTQRLNRYKIEDAGWRTVVAKWLCFNLLDPFQTGGHCR